MSQVGIRLKTEVVTPSGRARKLVIVYSQPYRSSGRFAPRTSSRSLCSGFESKVSERFKDARMSFTVVFLSRSRCQLEPVKYIVESIVTNKCKYTFEGIEPGIGSSMNPSIANPCGPIMSKMFYCTGCGKTQVPKSSFAVTGATASDLSSGS